MAITVKVSTAQFEAGAQQFERVRDECLQMVRRMMNTCTGLKGSWKGEAANNYYNKLQQIQGDLEDMKRIIDEHSKDLRAMKRVFEQAEDQVAVNVAGLNTDVLNY
ncbi:MAG: WXG100 family type VII secretion target [Oscillibacter sp.]|nr:WXG100 family type VII secretion target [Oscillibacter sp.]